MSAARPDLHAHTPELLTYLSNEKRALEQFLSLLKQREEIAMLEGESLMREFEHIQQVSEDFQRSVEEQADRMAQEEKETEDRCRREYLRMNEAMREWATEKETAKQAEQVFLQTQKHYMLLKQQEDSARNSLN